MNKMIAIIGYVLIFSTAFCVIGIVCYQRLDREKQKEEIQDYQKIEQIEKKTDIFGYIEIPKFHVQRIIKEGSVDRIIEDSYVAILGDIPKRLKREPLVLAAHSQTNIFEALHYLKRGDEIFVIHDQKRQKYAVQRKIVVDATTSLAIMKTGYHLALITCMDDPEKRLIILGN